MQRSPSGLDSVSSVEYVAPGPHGRITSFPKRCVFSLAGDEFHHILQGLDVSFSLSQLHFKLLNLLLFSLHFFLNSPPVRPVEFEGDCGRGSAWIGGDPQPRSRVNEQLKAERPHRGGPRPIETGGARWGLGAFAATTEAARVRVKIENGRKRITRRLHRSWNDWEVLIKEHHEGY